MPAPAEEQPPSSSRVQGACKSARNCNTRDLGEAQNKALASPRHGSRPVNATPHPYRPSARCASRNRSFPQPFPIRWTLRATGGVGPAGADTKYHSRPRSGHSGKPGFMLLGVLHWGPCNGRITVSVRTGGVCWGASVGGWPHLKDRDRRAACFRSRHQGASTGTATRFGGKLVYNNREDWYRCPSHWNPLDSAG